MDDKLIMKEFHEKVRYAPNRAARVVKSGDRSIDTIARTAIGLVNKLPGMSFTEPDMSEVYENVLLNFEVPKISINVDGSEKIDWVIEEKIVHIHLGWGRTV